MTLRSSSYTQFFSRQAFEWSIACLIEPNFAFADEKVATCSNLLQTISMNHIIESIHSNGLRYRSSWHENSFTVIFNYTLYYMYTSYLHIYTSILFTTSNNSKILTQSFLKIEYYILLLKTEQIFFFSHNKVLIITHCSTVIIVYVSEMHMHYTP